jgi:Fe-S-cluster containining protein
MTEAAAWKKFIRRYVVEDGEDKGEVEYILKHRKDHIYATICQFFDQDERRCTIYEARPSVCREYPDGKVCGYYNFLKFERKHQDDKEFIPSA